MAANDKKTAGIGKGTPGPGRPKGRQNDITIAAKEAFQAAFDKIGGVNKLVEWGMTEPGEFFKLYARLIPVDTKVSGGISVTFPLPRHPLEPQP